MRKLAYQEKGIAIDSQDKDQNIEEELYVSLVLFDQLVERQAYAKEAQGRHRQEKDLIEVAFGVAEPLLVVKLAATIFD